MRVVSTWQYLGNSLCKLRWWAQYIVRLVGYSKTVYEKKSRS